MKNLARVLISSVLAFIVSGILVGCGQYEGKNGDGTITFWSANNPFEVEHARELVKKWNTKHPDKQVNYQPIPEGRSSEEVMLAAIVGKTTPDIYSNVWPGVVQQYVDANVLFRLDSFPDFDSLYTSRIPAPLHRQFRSRDGRIYQLPWKGNPIVLQYNKRMFRRAGVQAPLASYSEFFDAADKLTRDTDGDGYYDQWMMDVDINVEWWHRWFDFYTFYISASGGKTLLDSSGQVIFNSNAGVETFRFFREGFAQKYFPNAFFQGDVFLQEKVAVHVSGPWNISHIEKFKPEGFEYGFMPIPAPDGYEGEPYTYGDPKSIGIFQSTKHPEIAWEFVKFYVSETADKRLMEITNQMPLRRGLLTDSLYQDYFNENPRYRFFAEMVPHIVGVDNSIYVQEIFDIISQEFDAACIQRVRAPEVGIRRAAERCRLLVEREQI